MTFTGCNDCIHRYIGLYTVKHFFRSKLVKKLCGQTCLQKYIAILHPCRMTDDTNSYLVIFSKGTLPYFDFPERRCGIKRDFWNTIQAINQIFPPIGNPVRISCMVWLSTNHFLDNNVKRKQPQCLWTNTCKGKS